MTARRSLYVKGAPERLIDMCDRQTGSGGAAASIARYWLRAVESLPPRGPARPRHRLEGRCRGKDATWRLPMSTASLAARRARRPDRSAARGGDRGDRANAAAPASRVKMITGDHAVTAAAIAGQLGLERSPRRADRPAISTRSTTPAFARSSSRDQRVRAHQPRAQAAAGRGAAGRAAPSSP